MTDEIKHLDVDNLSNDEVIGTSNDDWGQFIQKISRTRLRREGQNTRDKRTIPCGLRIE